MINIPQQLRKPIYDMLLHLLHDSNDIVVRFTAANTLRLCKDHTSHYLLVSQQNTVRAEELIFGLQLIHIVTDDLNFYASEFVEYLDSVINLVFKLLIDLREVDSKLQILNVVSTLISQMEEKVISTFVGCFV